MSCMFLCRLVAAIAAFSVCGEFVGAARAEALSPHRAVYEVSIAKVSQNDGVSGAHGTMVYVIADHCDGYTLETTMKMDMAYASGAYDKIDQRFAAWEAKDGRTSTFRMEISENGKMTRSHRGRIDLEEDGSGEITIESDGMTKFDVPPGTVLSSVHLLSVLESARAGRHFMSKPVIDGSFNDGAYQVAAVIGSSSAEPPEVSKHNLHEIGRGPHWPVGLAYFPYASLDDLPEYEVSIDLMQGGVAQAMLQDFGDFALRFELTYVEPLEPANCGDEH